jgi:ribosome maturation factor RimP
VTDDTIVKDVPSTIASAHPDVTVWDVELIAGEGLVRVLVDHPEGVSIGLCEEISKLLVDVRERYALEVSSPGLERPLVRTEHFVRSIGETVQVKLTRPVAGRKELRGRLLEADDASLRLVLEEGDEVEVPRASVRKSNIVWNPVTP